MINAIERTFVVRQGGRIALSLVERPIRVMRPTVWGNPYTVLEYGHEGAVAKYVTHLMRVPSFWRRIRTQLKGKALMCICHDRIDPFGDLSKGLPPACHADLLAFVADGGDITTLLPWATSILEKL